MDQENTQKEKSPEQNQSQAGPGPALPEVQREPSRKCKICGSPNHYGCGCEAKQLREAKEAGLTENEAKALQEPELQPASKMDDDLEDALSPQALIESLEASRGMANNIKTMADGFEGLCACFYDTNNLLKIMAGDLITIRKLLTKEDEVKNADPDKSAKNKN